MEIRSDFSLQMSLTEDIVTMLCFLYYNASVVVPTFNSYCLRFLLGRSTIMRIIQIVTYLVSIAVEV